MAHIDGTALEVMDEIVELGGATCQGPQLLPDSIDGILDEILELPGPATVENVAPPARGCGPG